MWIPTNQEFFEAIVDELQKIGKPVRYGDLWNKLRDEGKFGSKTTFNNYLKTLVDQGIIKREARRRLPNGRWITVRRGRSVKYRLVKTSPFSVNAPTNQISEWIKINLLKSKIDFLKSVQYCLKGDPYWRPAFSNFEKKMTRNMQMWSELKKRQDFSLAVRNIIDETEKEMIGVQNHLKMNEQQNVQNDHA